MPCQLITQNKDRWGWGGAPRPYPRLATKITWLKNTNLIILAAYIAQILTKGKLLLTVMFSITLEERHCLRVTCLPKKRKHNHHGRASNPDNKNNNNTHT